MGFELPAAIGAQLAMPERQVLSISGDGSFLQSMQELQTAVLAGTPVCAIVLDNSGWISIKGGQETFFGRSAWTDFRTPDGSLYSPDFDDIGRAFGLHAERVDDPTEVAPAVERALASGGPSLVHVTVDRDLAIAGPDKTGWWDAPSPEYHPEQRARWRGRRGRGAAPMTALARRTSPASPTSAPPCDDPATPCRRASIGTVPILWNNVDLRRPAPRHRRADDPRRDRPHRVRGHASSASAFPRARRCATRSPRAASGWPRSTLPIPATVDGPTDDAMAIGRERLRLLRDGGGDVLVRRPRRLARTAMHAPAGPTSQARRR